MKDLKVKLTATQVLANPYPRTSAMAAGINNHIWSIGEIVSLAD